MLNEAIINYCSLRYIPQEKIHMTLAQVLHWNGFGGNGEFLPNRDLINPAKDDPYIEELI